MDNSIKELGKIRDAIITGGISESQLRNMMNKVKEEYGDNVFKPYDLNSVQQYFYTKAYYEKLIKLAKNGACSQEFYLHMVNVRDSLKKQSVIKIGAIIASFVVIVLGIANLFISLNNSKLLKEIVINQNKPEVIVTVSEETKNNESQEFLKPKIEVKEVSSDTKSQELIVQDSDDINTKFVKRALNGEDVKDEYDKNPDTSKEGILEAIKALELNTEQIKIVGKNIKHDENSFIGE